MHEISIAQNVIDHVSRVVPPSDLVRVGRIRLRVGIMSGVVAHSLDFCFGALTHGTPLEGATLDIEERPFIVRCRTCKARSTNELGVAVCEECGSTDTQIESGTELDIVHLELSRQVSP